MHDRVDRISSEHGLFYPTISWYLFDLIFPWKIFEPIHIDIFFSNRHTYWWQFLARIQLELLRSVKQLGNRWTSQGLLYFEFIFTCWAMKGKHERIFVVSMFLLEAVERRLPALFLFGKEEVRRKLVGKNNSGSCSVEAALALILL